VNGTIINYILWGDIMPKNNTSGIEEKIEDWA